MGAGPRVAAVVSGRPFVQKWKQGKACVLTELQQIELCTWYKARCEIGTWKTKSNELGIPENTLKCIVNRRLGL